MAGDDVDHYNDRGDSGDDEASDDEAMYILP